jgi:hypothetical protein
MTSQDPLDDFPTTLATQDDVLQGLAVLARAALTGEIPIVRVDPVRKVLEAATKTIAAREIVKQNATRTGPNSVTNVQINNLAHPAGATRARSALDAIVDGDPLPSLSLIEAAEPLQAPLVAPKAAQTSQQAEVLREVRQGRTQLKRDFASLLTKGPNTAAAAASDEDEDDR